MDQNAFSQKTLQDIEQASRILSEGGLVAVPTETVYGLAADADNPQAVRSTFAVKGRPADHPLIVHVTGYEALCAWTEDQGPWAKLLADAFWPGPLTLVLKKSARVNDAVTGGQDTVAVRCPSHPVMSALLKHFEGGSHRAVTAPSANTFGRISPTCARHVFEDLGVKPEGKLDMILDGGECAVGVESTIVDLTSPKPTILRFGAVTAAMLEEVLGLAVAEAGSNAPRVSGRLKSHYAPQTKLVIVPAEEIAAGIESIDPSRTAYLLCGAGPLSDTLSASALRCITAPADPGGYAHVLYAALHELDACGAEKIVAQMPPQDADWAAVNDRLGRAAADRGHP